MNTEVIKKLELDTNRWSGVLDVEAYIYEKDAEDPEGVVVTIRILSKGEELMLTLFNYPDTYELVEPEMYIEELIEDYGEDVARLIVESVKYIKAEMIAHFLKEVEIETIQ